MNYNDTALLLLGGTLVFLILAHVLRQMEIKRATYRKKLRMGLPVDADVTPERLPTVAGTPFDAHMIVQAVISIILLCAALWIIIEPEHTTMQETWAMATVTLIVGFWIPKIP